MPYSADFLSVWRHPKATCCDSAVRYYRYRAKDASVSQRSAAFEKKAAAYCDRFAADLLNTSSHALTAYNLYSAPAPYHPAPYPDTRASADWHRTLRLPGAFSVLLPWLLRETSFRALRRQRPDKILLLPCAQNAETLPAAAPRNFCQTPPSAGAHPARCTSDPDVSDAGLLFFPLLLVTAVVCVPPHIHCI